MCITPKWRGIDRHSYASQNQIPNLGRGNESALAFYCFSFLSWKRFKISSCGNYYLSLLILGAIFVKVHQNQYSDLLRLQLRPNPPLHSTPCFSLYWRSTPICHNFSKSPIVTQRHHDSLGAKEREEEVSIGHECNVVGSGLL